MESFSIIQNFITVLTPIIVAWFGYKQVKSQKQTKEYQELQAKYEEEKEKLRKKEADDQKALFEEFRQSLESLQNEVRGLKEAQANSKVEKDIASLVTMSNINFEYCQSLSKVIGSIGEALTDVPTVDSDTINTALEKHKDEEQALVRKIYKISY